MKKLFSEIPYIRGETVELRQLNKDDAAGLAALTGSEEVYRYLPTFLFEKKYDDSAEVIGRMYDECLKKSLILGIFRQREFCGLAEAYGYRAPLLKASVGYRLLPDFWGMGIATETLALLTDWLFSETDIKVITESVMPDNKASASVLGKNGFRCVARSMPEYWGYALPTLADKWIKSAGIFTDEHRNWFSGRRS